jgi:hypothetical protein
MELRKMRRFLFIACIAMCGCASVAKDAITTRIGSAEANLENLEKLVDQKADNTVTAERIDEVRNEITQVTKVADTLVKWKTSVQAETINYGGAGWVVLGSAVIIMIFLGAFGLLIRMLLKKIHLLKFVTGAVKRADPDTQKAIKKAIKAQVACPNTKYTERDKLMLKECATKCGHALEDE